MKHVHFLEWGTEQFTTRRMGQALGNFLCPESCPTQLNDMGGIELIYGVTSIVPKVLANTFAGEFSLSVKKACGATRGM